MTTRRFRRNTRICVLDDCLEEGNPTVIPPTNAPDFLRSVVRRSRGRRQLFGGTNCPFWPQREEEDDDTTSSLFINVILPESSARYSVSFRYGRHGGGSSFFSLTSDSNFCGSARGGGERRYTFFVPSSHLSPLENSIPNTPSHGAAYFSSYPDRYFVPTRCARQ